MLAIRVKIATKNVNNLLDDLQKLLDNKFPKISTNDEYGRTAYKVKQRYV